MAEVLDLNEARAARDAGPEPEEHDDDERAATIIAGPALCLACRHEWAVVTGDGDEAFDLECPSCGTFRGQLVHPITDLPKDVIVWQCGCGSMMFQIVHVDELGYLAKSLEAETPAPSMTYQTAMYCVGCGRVQEF